MRKLPKKQEVDYTLGKKFYFIRDKGGRRKGGNKFKTNSIQLLPARGYLPYFGIIDYPFGKDKKKQQSNYFQNKRRFLEKNNLILHIYNSVDKIVGVVNPFDLYKQIGDFLAMHIVNVPFKKLHTSILRRIYTFIVDNKCSVPEDMLIYIQHKLGIISSNLTETGKRRKLRPNFKALDKSYNRNDPFEDTSRGYKPMPKGFIC